MWPFKVHVERQPLDLEQVSIHPLDGTCVLNRFECGKAPLDKYLKNTAKGHAKRLERRVYAATLEGSPNCIGYYALQLGSDAVPETYKKNRQDLSRTTRRSRQCT